jgi:hypothetical protein
LLAAYPEYANAYAQALSTYHDRLFAYAKAFEVGTHWVGRHPDDINAQANLAEAHLATGRFQEARNEAGFADLQPQLPPGTAAGLRALQIANLVSLNKPDLIPGKSDSFKALSPLNRKALRESDPSKERSTSSTRTTRSPNIVAGSSTC